MASKTPTGMNGPGQAMCRSAPFMPKPIPEGIE